MMWKILAVFSMSFSLFARAVHVAFHTVVRPFEVASKLNVLHV